MKELSNQELAAFCNQFSMILKSGISSLEGVSILLEDAANAEEKALLESIYEEMLTTGQFYEALSKTSRFPSYMLEMVSIGEETGNLDNVMESLGAYYDREHAISQSIKNAVYYPMIMVGMMLFIIVIMLTKVLPVFQQVFAQLGQEMTGLSRSVLLLGNFISDYSFVWIGAAIAAVLAVFFLTKNGGRFLPRRLQNSMDSCRFAESMALALKSGMTPEQGFEYAKRIIEHPDYLARIDACSQKVSDGSPLSAALQESGIFSGVYARMTSIADKTGSMDEAMVQISEEYEEEVHSKITGFIAALEPTLVIILSVIVGIILLSVMLPLTGIMTAL